MGGSVSKGSGTLTSGTPQRNAQASASGVKAAHIDSNAKRLILITELIAPYRVPEFNALAEHPDIDLHVIFLAETDPSMRQWRVYKDEIRFSYEVLPSWRWQVGPSNVLMNRGLGRALRTADPDAMVVGGYNYPASWQALFWAHRRSVPFCLWSESNSADRRSHRKVVELLKTRFLRDCCGFVVPGRSSRQYLLDLGVRDKPIFIAPNAVDNDLFSRLAHTATKDAHRIRTDYKLPDRFFLYVGRLIPSKGVFDLLEAYAGLKSEIRSEVGLVFVGDGASQAQLTKRASGIHPGRVQCFGFIHREQLPEFYSLAEAFVFPTHSDPWGLVVNEAMACGLPIIATNVGGCVADLVEDGWNGFVIPASQPVQLTAALETIATDSTLRRRMAGNSLERIQLYSPSAWAEGMAAVMNLA